MLRWRLILGTVFIALLAGLFWLDLQSATPGIFLFPLALILAVVAAGEMLRLTCVRDQRPIPWVVYGGAFLVVAATGVPHLWPGYPADCPLGDLGWPLLGLAAAALAAFVGEMFRYENPPGLTQNLALGFLSATYVGLLLAFLVKLRFVSGETWNGVPLISMRQPLKSIGSPLV